MSKPIENGSNTSGGGARFDSPLSLWITIWQRQLVYGSGDPASASVAGSGSPSGWVLGQH